MRTSTLTLYTCYLPERQIIVAWPETLKSCMPRRVRLQWRILGSLRTVTESRQTSSDDGQSLDDETGLGTLDAVGQDLSAGAESAEQTGIPMIAYPKQYCRKCGEMAFCHRAWNPGCGGAAIGGVATFQNRNHGKGCKAGAVLTVPRSYVRDIGALGHVPGAETTLTQMLQSGFRFYQHMGHTGPVWQCIHSPKHVSVRWLHLHTFCLDGRVDNLPTRHDYCAKMSTWYEAPQIAAKWLHHR